MLSLCYLLMCDVALRYNTCVLYLRHDTIFYPLTLCYVILFYVMSCNATCCDVLLCCAT